MKSLLFLFTGLFFIQGNPVAFEFKNYDSFVFYFDKVDELVTFFDFKKGQVIADIGCGNGNKAGVFSLWTDSLAIYLEDIDPKVLGKNTAHRIIRKFSKIKGEPVSNVYKTCLGTVSATNLPDGGIDKVILISSFHEFTFKDEMLNDIQKKLKSGGKVYLLETYCYSKNHINVSEEEAIRIFEKNGFRLLKKENPRYEKTYRMVFEPKK